MNWKNFKIIASFLTVLVLSACGNDACVRGDRECGAGHCIDADDWGFPKIYVPAEAKELNLRTEPLLNQYAEAIDTHQVLVDAENSPLVLTIGKRDQWTSWFGGDLNPRDSSGTPDADGFDGGRQVPDRECVYYLPPGKTSPAVNAPSSLVLDLSPTTLKVNRSFSGVIPNPVNTPPLDMVPDNYADAVAPCYFRYGMGLYVGLAPNNGQYSSADDVVLTYHIPDSKRPDYAYDESKNNLENLAIQARDGYLVRGIPKEELPGAQTGDRLYFKIVDRTYTDNTGGYTVKIKSGTRDDKAGPLERISSAFVDPMRLVMNRVYNGIVQNPVFINAVRAVLVLYMAFYGFIFSIGGLAEAKKEAFNRVIKMAIVVTVISPGSWDFFYNHLFAAFIDGAKEIAALLMNPFGDYDPGNPWYSMDKLLARFFAHETWDKIWSTLFSNYVGILFIPAMGLAIGVFIMATVRAVIVYLLAIAGMAVLVIIAPIFIIFMLFSKTKELMKEWFDQIFVFALQEIILLAALGLFAAIIVMFLERTLGYNVCWNVWFPFGIGDINIYNFKFWMPDISGEQVPLWIDSDGDGVREVVTRYLDMPYFDPVFDKGIIAKYASEKNFISFADILILVASVFLMHRFMALVPMIASTLKSGAAGNSMNIFESGFKLGASLTGAAVDGVTGAINASKAIRGGASDLAANSEARYVGNKAKRAGINAAKNAGTALAATSAGQSVVRAVRRFVDENSEELGSSITRKYKRAFDAIERAVEARKAQQPYSIAGHDVTQQHALGVPVTTMKSAAEIIAENEAKAAAVEIRALDPVARAGVVSGVNIMLTPEEEEEERLRREEERKKQEAEKERKAEEEKKKAEKEKKEAEEEKAAEEARYRQFLADKATADAARAEQEKKEQDDKEEKEREAAAKLKRNQEARDAAILSLTIRLGDPNLTENERLEIQKQIEYERTKPRE